MVWLNTYICVQVENICFRMGMFLFQTKFQLIQLMGELSPKKNSSTPHPITWVPVAAADRVGILGPYTGSLQVLIQKIRFASRVSFKKGVMISQGYPSLSVHSLMFGMYFGNVNFSSRT